jgi:hypothetical protein
MDDEDRDFEQLLNLIRSLGGSVTPRQLMRCSRRFTASVNIATAFLQSLVDAGLGHITWPHKNGRPSMLFQLSPSVDVDKTPSAAPENRTFVNAPSKPDLPP